MSQVKISHAINGNLPFKNQRAYDHLAQKANSDQYTREWQGKICPFSSIGHISSRHWSLSFLLIYLLLSC
jgi:hypothetical protein